MSDSPSETAEFDAYAAEYDAALSQGLSVSGEDKSFFARGRIICLRRSALCTTRHRCYMAFTTAGPAPGYKQCVDATAGAAIA